MLLFLLLHFCNRKKASGRDPSLHSHVMMVRKIIYTTQRAKIQMYQLLRLAHRTKKVEEVSDTPRFCIYFTKYDCTIQNIIIECASRTQKPG